ncbi:MAG TPA: translation initiation factor [Hanamia sp.]|jgi:translation initiation factor 1|nr:translation initiation factor [Hanamia sp.]
MPKKKLYNSDGIVYSTAENFNFSKQEETKNYLAPNEQLLKVVLDKKHRAGKVVSIIKGFSMKDDEIESVAKKLKVFCGSGGSVKDDEIIIQGDHREKILQWLLKNNFTKSRKI